MVEQSTIKTGVSFVLAVLLTIGFTAAPAAALTQDSVVGDGPLDGIDADTSDAGGSSTDGVQVRIVETNSPVQTGQQLNVTVDVVSNDGGTAELLIDGESVDERGFAPGQDDTVDFTWSTSYQDAGEHNATVRSGDDSDTETVQVEAGASAPEQTCTNVPKTANENVPYGQAPSPTEELPEQVPNPVPPFIGPESATNLAIGALPTQCEIQDPNDPSIDPTNPPSDPNADYSVLRAGQYQDGGAVWITYRATLNQSGEGPSVSGSLGGVASSGVVDGDPSVTLNDGAQEYTVDPHFDGDTSTADGSLTVDAPFGGAGGSVDCSGGECQPGSSGIPTFREYPAVPAPIWSGEDD